MKYVGKNGLRIGDNEVWHEGNFNPSSKSDTGHAHTKANITDFPTSLPANGGNADTVDGKHYSDITNYVDSGIDDIEVGGRNLLIQEHIVSGYISQNGTIGSSGMGALATENYIEVVQNTDYTYSAREEGTSNLDIALYDEDKLFIRRLRVNDSRKTLYTFNVENASFIRLSHSELRNKSKLEKGNKATDWTPAPEDVQAEIDLKADKTQVLTNVPADAKFTDTTYTEVTTAEIDAGTASTLRTITGRRIKYVLDKVQGWISALTKADIGLANVDNVKQATKTEFDTHNGDTTKHITAAERTSWNGKWAYNENTIKAVKVNNAVNADTVNGKTVAVDVPSGAKFTDTVYTHPATHPPSIIAQDAGNRFVTDTEKAAWNGKEPGFTKNTAFNKNFETAAANIKMNGAQAAVGTSANVARADHVHPVDTSRAAASHNHTKSQITDFAHSHAIGDLPVAASGTSSTTQLVRADDSRLSNARAPTTHTHTKSQITDMPTKLSQFENDIGAGAGLNIVVSPTEPPQLVAGDWWYKEI